MSIPIGGRGRVLVQLMHPFPVTRLQVRIAAQVIAEVIGQELRDLAGLYFSVPRVAGDFAMTVFAEDSRGCMAVTTAPRMVTVTP